MNKKFLLYSILLFSLCAVFAHAQTTPPVVVATVNIQDAKIVSQKENVFQISFVLSNREGLQTGVNYGVKLVANSTSGQVLVDEIMYPEKLTLLPNSRITKEITYTAPSQLNGTYALVLFSNNASGFPFAISYVDDVALYSPGNALYVNPQSCGLQLAQDKSNKVYGLSEGVAVTARDTLRLTCTAENSLNRAVNVIPTYETYLRSINTEPIAVTGGSVLPITIPNGTKTSFTIDLPNSRKPGTYLMRVALEGTDATSNTIPLTYSVPGVYAVITNLTLDKTEYAKGETAVIGLLWSSSQRATAEISITNRFGRKCTAPITQELVLPKKEPVTEITATITTQCTSPKVTVAIKDVKGTVLDQKEFSFVGDTNELYQKKVLYGTIGALVLLLLIALVRLLLKRRKISAENTSNIN